MEHRETNIIVNKSAHIHRIGRYVGECNKCIACDLGLPVISMKDYYKKTYGIDLDGTV